MSILIGPTWTKNMILDIQGNQTLISCAYMNMKGFFFVSYKLKCLDLLRSSRNACLAILHRTVTPTRWLPLLQNKTELEKHMY